MLRLAMFLLPNSFDLENTHLDYFVSPESKNPGKLWLSSGIHGDEFSVIAPLRELVEVWASRLPSTIFVPIISPTAAATVTRNNHFDHDLNRMFGTGILDSEVMATEKLVRAAGPFDLAVSFHEDIEFDLAYLLDAGEPFYKLELQAWQNGLRAGGLKLLDGLDDIENLTMALEFISGYQQEIIVPESGLFEYWIVREKLAKRSLTIEVPTAATLDQKKLIINQTFEHLILPAFA